MSTRTIYNHFLDKAQLFQTVIQESAKRVAEAQIAIIDRYLHKVTDLELDLIEFGRAWVAPMPDYADHFALVRQINAEAGHIPQAAIDAWQATGPLRVRRELARRLQQLADSGLLHIDDADRAAHHFALLVSVPNPSYRGSAPPEEVIGSSPRMSPPACAPFCTDTSAARHRMHGSGTHMARVLLREVIKKFGSVTAVDDLTLEIDDREFVTLVGPSGCGKTTTLRLIAGLEKVTAGHIYFDDDAVGHLPADHRDIAMVFQSYALYPHMNVYDNIGFALRMMRVPRPEIDRRVKWAAEMLGITGLLQRKPRQLSGGQRQRVALGRSVVREPACFLLDEPLSNLDAKLRVTMRGELKRLHLELKRTFIYVTHDQAEALTMSDRIAVMNDGRLQQYASPDEIYNRPRNVFVAGFMGSPAMNLLLGELVNGEATPRFTAPGLDQPLPDRLADVARRARARRVYLGIRPESIVVRGDGVDAPPRGAAWITLPVYIQEPLGSDQYLTLEVGDTHVKARTSPDLAVRAGDRVEVAFDPTKLHLFDGESGVSLLHG